MVSKKPSATPSTNFSIKLPTKPSQRATSQTPWNNSRPSALPTKLTRSSSRNSSPVCLTREVPLADSSPTDSNATRGFSIPTTFWAYRADMTAYWPRWAGLAWMFAPQSHRTKGPWNDGITTAMPGRSTPGRARSFNWQAAAKAPVLPALRTASTSRAAASLAVFSSEESFF